MSILFYDHLIEWSKLEEVFDRLGLSKEDRLLYLEEIEKEMHAEIISVVLDHLSPQFHEEFIVSFEAAPHDPQHLHYLVSNGVPDIESAIKGHSGKLIAQICTTLEVSD